MAQQNNQISGAITYPTNGNVGQPAVVQPRQPRNLQGLLKFCMEATKAEDAPHQSHFAPMDEERRKFLEAALKSMTVDIADVLQKCIKVLIDADKIKAIKCDSQLPEDVETSFDNILEFVIDIDTANDFFKLGGFGIFPVCFDCENDLVRAKAAEILAELCQNNPFCQAKVLDCGLLDVIIHMVENEQSQIVLSKSLYALSCAIREFDPCCKELISQGGCSVLLKCLINEHLPVRTKTAFLILYLVKNHPRAKDDFIRQNITEHLIDLISRELNDSTSHLLALMLQLLEDRNENVLSQCRTATLKSALEKHLRGELSRNDVDYKEEKEYCEEIMKILFSGSFTHSDNVER